MLSWPTLFEEWLQDAGAAARPEEAAHRLDGDAWMVLIVGF